jgi:hypothetical protein
VNDRVPACIQPVDHIVAVSARRDSRHRFSSEDVARRDLAA